MFVEFVKFHPPNVNYLFHLLRQFALNPFKGLISFEVTIQYSTSLSYFLKSTYLLLQFQDLGQVCHFGLTFEFLCVSFEQHFLKLKKELFPY